MTTLTDLGITKLDDLERNIILEALASVHDCGTDEETILTNWHASDIFYCVATFANTQAKLAGCDAADTHAMDVLNSLLKTINRAVAL